MTATRSFIIFAIFIILATNSGVNCAPLTPQNDQIVQLIQALYTHPWPGAEIVGTPMTWAFHFTAPMQALLEIGPAAQQPLLAKLFDTRIVDQAIILLGGVGDERSVDPMILAMQRASALPEEQRKRTLQAGNVALTNITVADVIWHHGGGIILDRCPDDPGRCWAAWWEQHKATFRVRDITQSRRYSNYPNYGIYHNLK